MRPSCAALLFLSTLSLHSQDRLPIPRPFVSVSMDLPSGGGYQSIAPVGSAGIQINTAHFLFSGKASYESARKTNDNTQPNPKGRERAFGGSAYYRFSSQWFAGGGAGWGQLSTTNYSKQSWHPNFGGGKDLLTRDCQTEGCRHDFTARLSASYVLPGSDWQNGVHGINVTFGMPSPTARRHLFYEQGFSLSRFHDTLTDRTNVPMTREQLANRHFWADMSFSLIYRL